MGKAFSKSVSPNKAEPAATQAKPAEAAAAPTQQVEAPVIPPVQEAAVPEKPAAAVVEEPVAAEPVVESVPETKAEPEPEPEVPAAPVPVVEDVAPEVPAAPLPEEEVVVPEPVKEVPTQAEPEPLVAVSEPPAPEPVVEPEPVPEPVPEPEVIPAAPEPVVEAEPEPALDEPVDLLTQESVPLSAPLVDLGVPDFAASAALDAALIDAPFVPDDPPSPLEPTDVLGDEGCQDGIEDAVNSAASPEEPEESTPEVPADLLSGGMESVEQPLCDVNQEVSDGPLKHLDLTGNGFMNDLIPNDVQIPDDIPIADVSLSNELM